jgi:hypothetical protein
MSSILRPFRLRRELSRLPTGNLSGLWISTIIWSFIDLHSLSFLEECWTEFMLADNTPSSFRVQWETESIHRWASHSAHWRSPQFSRVDCLISTVPRVHLHGLRLFWTITVYSRWRWSVNFDHGRRSEWPHLRLVEISNHAWMRPGQYQMSHSSQEKHCGDFKMQSEWA